MYVNLELEKKFLKTFPQPDRYEDPDAWEEWREIYDQFITSGIIPDKKVVGNLTNTILIAWNTSSLSARHFAKALGITFRGVGSYASRFEQHKTKAITVLNWGCRSVPPGSGHVKLKYYNHPTNVSNYWDQYSVLTRLQLEGVPVPETTNKLGTALTWVKEGKKVLGYSSAIGTSNPCWSDDLAAFPRADFWARYHKKKTEFRLHVAFGDIIGIEEKVPRAKDSYGNKIDPSEIDFKLRTQIKGFIWKEVKSAPPSMMTLAAQAITALGLDFGAVDVIWNPVMSRGFVLDVSCHPPLSTDLMEAYTKAFQKKIGTVSAL